MRQDDRTNLNSDRRASIDAVSNDLCVSTVDVDYSQRTAGKWTLESQRQPMCFANLMRQGIVAADKFTYLASIDAVPVAQVRRN